MLFPSHPLPTLGIQCLTDWMGNAAAGTQKNRSRDNQTPYHRNIDDFIIQLLWNVL